MDDGRSEREEKAFHNLSSSCELSARSCASMCLVMVAMVISLRHKAIFGGRATGSSQWRLGVGALIKRGPRLIGSVTDSDLLPFLPLCSNLSFLAAAVIKGCDCAAEGTGVPRLC